MVKPRNRLRRLSCDGECDGATTESHGPAKPRSASSIAQMRAAKDPGDTAGLGTAGGALKHGHRTWAPSSVSTSGRHESTMRWPAKRVEASTLIWLENWRPWRPRSLPARVGREISSTGCRTWRPLDAAHALEGLPLVSERCCAAVRDWQVPAPRLHGSVASGQYRTLPH
jgi:hypothetical protein